MWDEPYLETCCRSALHRLTLCGRAGRPPGMKDGPCLQRLCDMGLAEPLPDRGYGLGRYGLTALGVRRHADEIGRAA